MLDEKQKEALRKWYNRSKVIEEAKRIVQDKNWEDLEEFLQMRVLMPLGRHHELPEYLKTADDKALIPNNCNPSKDLEEWRDAVEVAWSVVEPHIGISQLQVNTEIKNQQDHSWQTFLESVEQRKRERGLK